MSENKYTPEPWTYYDDRKSTGRIEIVGFGKTVSRIYLSVPDEDVANARRIVACVNACAGCLTEVLETAPIGFFNSTYGHPKYLEEITKQRDELLAATEAIAINSEECLDFDECTAMLVSIDDYHRLMEAVARAKGEQ